jgi:DNA-binding transcriptional MerR regulator
LDAGHTSFEAPEDFEVLKQFKSLQYIEAGLSLEQVKELQKALPDCLIHSP